MSKRLSHARHNETICDLLSGEVNHVDWVITTAFYAALHYTEHKLFPMNYNDGKNKIRIKTLANYYSFVYPYGTPNIPNKHAFRLQLVNNHLPNVGADYKWLKDTCYNARYVDYQFSNPINYITSAKSRLAKIKSACT